MKNESPVFRNFGDMEGEVGRYVPPAPARKKAAPGPIIPVFGILPIASQIFSKVRGANSQSRRFVAGDRRGSGGGRRGWNFSQEISSFSGSSLQTGGFSIYRARQRRTDGLAMSKQEPLYFAVEPPPPPAIIDDVNARDNSVGNIGISVLQTITGPACPQQCPPRSLSAFLPREKLHFTPSSNPHYGLPAEVERDCDTEEIMHRRKREGGKKKSP